jgi:hypothetical protein
VFDIEGSRDTEGSECEGDTQGVSESEEGVMGAVAVLKSPVPEGRGFLLARTVFDAFLRIEV